MIGLIKFTAKQLLFWLILFILYQCTFLFLFSSELTNIDSLHILSSFKFGLSLNLASASYITILSLLLYFISTFFKSGLFQKINYCYVIIVVIICFVINTADFSLFQNWGTKINGKAIWYLQFSDSSNTTKGYTGLWKYALALFLISLAAIIIYTKILNDFKQINLKVHSRVSGFLILIFILFIALRGGLSGKPIDKGSGFYSKYAVLNYASINGFWNFFDLITNFKTPPKPYSFLNKSQIDSIKNEIISSKTKSIVKLSKVSKPNIIFIFLESWNADVVGCISGEKGITPYFDKLSENGVLFTNFYSTGFRTEQGLMAALSGFPAQAQTYPMLDFDRFDKYPNLIKDLSKIGYYTSYYTGGNSHFANTDVYLTSAGIDKINKDLLKTAKRKSAWGAYDEESFDYMINGLNNQKQPFFSTIVTITSHEWFEADVPKKHKDKDIVSARYKNTVSYTDSCLFDFIKKAEKKDWYKNSLIFIMADHSCSYPHHRKMNEPERYHIPFLITGGALNDKFKNIKNRVSACHLNLPALVCDELNLNKRNFIFSENLISDSISSFAYYAFDHGFGIIQNNNLFVWDLNLKKPIYKRGTVSQTDFLQQKGNFIMQYSSMLKEEYQVKK
ncbi:MAG: LTA synthase family protein [Bacteroidia bacterium]|nr:LTA synthase family protein [Bacteroidia bacterium]